MVDFADNAWAFRGADGHDRSHIPAQPLWTAALRLGQLLVGFIVFVLTAYAAGQLGSGFPGFGLMWFTYIWTLGYIAYLVVSLLFMPAIYNYWAHLGLEILSVIWWLCTWAVLASEASAWNSIRFGFGFGRGFGRYETAIDCVKASAGLGALVWLFFLATLAFLVLSILNHQKAGGGMAPNAPPGGPVGPVGQAPPQQPVYPQQAYQQPAPEGYPQGQYPTPEQQQQYPAQGQYQQPMPQQQAYAGADQQYAPAQEVPGQQAPYPPTQQQQTPYPQ